MSDAGFALRCPACESADIRNTIFTEGIIHVCPACHLQWADRTASAIEGDTDITGAHGRYMDPASIDTLRYEPYVTFFKTVETLLGRKPRRILDVGCGNGVFMAEAARRGIDVWGIELDERHRGVISADLLPKVSFTYAEDALPTMEGLFDVVAFWDSFEHMNAPYALLAHVLPRLAPDGLVFIRVNNTRDIFNMITRAATVLSPRTVGPRMLKTCFNLPQHAWNFSVKGMALLLQKHGWEIISNRATETPASRLFPELWKRLILSFAYTFNRLIGGGKIGEYYIRPICKKS